MIDKLIHRCIVPDGDMAGNKHAEEVSAFQLEYDNECSVCGEPVATTEQIIIHIYEQLTEGGA